MKFNFSGRGFSRDTANNIYRDIVENYDNNLEKCSYLRNEAYDFFLIDVLIENVIIKTKYKEVNIKRILKENAFLYRKTISFVYNFLGNIKKQEYANETSEDYNKIKTI